MPLRIWVDDREARVCGVAKLLAEREGVAVRMKRLRTGDYVIEGKAVLERKRVRDFLESLRQGRLFAQARRLAASPLRPFLILEGAAQDWRHAGVNRVGIQGALVALAVGFGIPILRSQNEAETARLILFTARQLNGGAGTVLRRPAKRVQGKRARQVFILTAIPGVGPDRALRLLNHFGSIEQVATATPAALAQVKGIGEKTAQSIHWAVHEATIPYQA